MKEWIKNYKKSSKKLTLSNIVNFIAASYRNILQKDWQKEQVEWREERIKVNSPECVNAQQCQNCYCDFEDGLLYENKACEKGCYPRWMNKMEWDYFNTLSKEQKNLFIKIKSI